MRGWRPLLPIVLAAAAGFWACAAAAGPQHPTPVATAGTAGAASTTDGAAERSRLDYRLQPGDIVSISVWKEKDLSTEALVRPDGGLSFPLVGDIVAEGRTIAQVRQALDERLKPYIPDPVVSVAIKAIGGNHVYVIGKVNRPGEFDFSQPIDVMQALSLAGGTTPFAELNHIVILQRDNEGVEHAIHFHYAAIAHGRDLDQNVLLKSGDTVVVP